MIASSGSGGTLQAFFTEGEDFSVFPSVPGNAVSVLTQVEAVGTCVTVTPTVTTLTPSTPTLAVTDFTEQTGLVGCPCASCQSPLTATITPTIHDIPGANGGPDALGTTNTSGPDGVAGTADDERIPGILRFPFPSAVPPTAVRFPSGMTRVALPNTVFGSDLFNNHVFQITSGAIIAPPPPPPVVKGRMTGGGSVFQGSRVTHGFELHCDASKLPNNLQVNWGGNRFHLTQLNSATCSDDPNISEGQPVAGFDTFVGSGVGRLNGVDGATIDFKLTDAGEPGKGADLAEFSINGGAALAVAGTLNSGNHQAHPE